ncbi:LacI family DNA-binding transcriptional regulator [Duganella sp. FT92W]|uniref:LacI family DNA-binding transcriptional regulator n=1 Tax=Pseudoduganella rivuli TaxID=2666085 RepID=A0A7X2IKV9_9BURK|nr:LacI family DNA-binding transcriptional regulator [Pseudoduganella rivuli]MRV71593.1 LacI family DNA-binding transcriptional regulator [Pseudoduganella rivuli]
MSEKQNEQRVEHGFSTATIHDVARAANVSPMTVSRVVNGRVRVGEETRVKVMAAVEALGYKVNVAARAARIGTLRIGLLFSNPSAAFMSEFLVGALDQSSQRGAQLILENCKTADGQRAAIDKLIADGADGILVPPPLCDCTSTLSHLDDISMPMVAIATACPARHTSAVRIDDYEGAGAMTRHLLALGHRDIAFIKGDPAHTPTQLRFQAFMDVCIAAGVPVPPGRIAEGMFTYRSGLMAARKLLARRPWPTAIFASNDDMAAAVIAVAHGLRLRVPEDLAVCGFDDTPIATAVWPELTTVRQPIGDMARTAIDLVIEQIRYRADGTRLVQHRLLPYKLIKRDSTGTLA